MFFYSPLIQILYEYDSKLKVPENLAIIWTDSDSWFLERECAHLWFLFGFHGIMVGKSTSSLLPALERCPEISWPLNMKYQRFYFFLFNYLRCTVIGIKRLCWYVGLGKQWTDIPDFLIYRNCLGYFLGVRIKRRVLCSPRYGHFS